VERIEKSGRGGVLKHWGLLFKSRIDDKVEGMTGRAAKKLGKEEFLRLRKDARAQGTQLYRNKTSAGRR